MICVFDNPAHAGGGCIFADPGIVLEIDTTEAGGGESNRRYIPRMTTTRAIAMREDDELMAMLQAYFISKKH